ncbi:MAG: hypothetical protein EOO41_04955, partial [Methanobacteriota archaeon]
MGYALAAARTLVMSRLPTRSSLTASHRLARAPAASGVPFGVCLPVACSVADILNPELGIMGFIIGQIPSLLFLDPYDAVITCGDNINTWTPGGIAMAALISTAGALVLLGTVLDLWDRVKHRDVAQAAGSSARRPLATNAADDVP